MSWLQRAKRQGSRYLAPIETSVGGFLTFLKALPMMLRGREGRTPRVLPGPFSTEPALYAGEPQSGLRVTWFGHSSVLLEVDGTRVLVDPVWDDRAAPVSWAGPKRFFPPTLPLRGLPSLDAVLLSHDHYDHLGRDTVRQLANLQPKMRWIVSAGVGRIVRGFGVATGRVTELDWTQGTLVRGTLPGAELTVTAVPARHFSGRALWNRNQTLWSAFVLRGPRHRVYCGADTGLWPGFGEIAAAHGPFDLTLLEIGAFNELWRDIHLGPLGAAQAFAELGGGTLMPIHWGLFDLALHPWQEPITELIAIAEARGLRLFSPRPGQPTEPDGQYHVSDWWRAG